MTAFLFTYLLGAFTFWPLVGLAVYVYVSTSPKESAAPATQAQHREVKDDSVSDNGFDNIQAVEENIKDKVDFTEKGPAPLKQTIPNIQIQPDRFSEVEASAYVRLAPMYLTSVDPYDDIEAQMSIKERPQGSARGSLRKLMSRKFFSQKNGKFEKIDDSDRVCIQSGSNLSSSNLEVPCPKSVAKCPLYWAVVRAAQLQIYEDNTEKILVELIPMPKYVVTIWPQDLQEFELFYKRYPLCLISRSDPEGLVSLDMYPGVAPRDAYYLYVDNPIVKEDLYFALIRSSKLPPLDLLDAAAAAGLSSASTFTGESLSLGPRDPIEMTRPMLLRKHETQLLQSSIWNSDNPPETQWLNGVLGRLFLGIKDTPYMDDYLRRKFNYKLKPVNASSNIIGDIEVKSINCGTSAPHISSVKLRELTSEGSLVLGAGISYTGGFQVILGTIVKLAALTSLTSAEIPIELAATVSSLQGTILFKIKPPPSERIWYAFETMPEVDLQIVPTVYETHISLSVVTKFIRSKLLDLLKEALVAPYFDDISFYDTTGSFYRGGIWVPSKTVVPNAPVTTSTNSGGVNTTTTTVVPADTLLGTATDERPSVLLDNNNVIDTMNSQGDLSPSISTGDGPGASLGAACSDRRASRNLFSKWVNNKKRTSRQNSVSGPLQDLDNESLASLSPSSVRHGSFTTQITPVSSDHREFSPNISPALRPNDTLMSEVPAVSPTPPLTDPCKITVRRRPVPPPPPNTTASSTAFEVIPTALSDAAPSEVAPAPSGLRITDIPNAAPTMTAPTMTASTMTASPKVSPVPSGRSPPIPNRLDLPLFSQSQASTELSNEIIPGEIIEPEEVTNVPVPKLLQEVIDSSSVKSGNSGRSGHSAKSTNSSRAPVLPPRHRRVVPLANVAPEHL